MPDGFIMEWSCERGLTADNKPVLALRDGKHCLHALVMADVEHGHGYMALMLEPGMPSRSGFKHAFQAALWAQRWIVRHRDRTAKFRRGVPALITTPKKDKAHARQADDRGRVDRSS